MITYRQAKFDDVEKIHKLLNDYAKAGLMLPRSRNAIYENLRDYIVAMQGSHLVGCGIKLCKLQIWSCSYGDS